MAIAWRAVSPAGSAHQPVALDARLLRQAAPVRFADAPAVEHDAVAGLPAPRGRCDSTDAGEVDAGDHRELAHHRALAGDGQAVLVVERRVLDAHRHRRRAAAPRRRRSGRRRGSRRRPSRSPGPGTWSRLLRCVEATATATARTPRARSLGATMGPTMTSIDGHILTPDGFVRGRVVVDGARIAARRRHARAARTTARGDVTAAARAAGLHRPARARRRRADMMEGGDAVRRSGRAACAPRHHGAAGHDDDGADGRPRAGAARAGAAVPRPRARRGARARRAPRRAVHQRRQAGRAAELRAAAVAGRDPARCTRWRPSG